MKLHIKKLRPGAIVPQYATDGAACFDLHAIHPCRVPPGDATVLDTGLAFEVPAGHVMLVFSRSGHGFNAGVRLVNSVGVIDSDYRGEVKVGLHNDGAEPFIVRPGDRAAQAMLVPIPRVDITLVDELPDTARGAGGFGSTGQ